MNIPNMLSLVRLILVPVFTIVYMMPTKDPQLTSLIAGCIFVVAAVTDIIDGYLARKWNQITKVGRILDPLADKLLQATAIACLTIRHIMPLVLCILFLAKELMMLCAGLFLVNKLNDVLPSNLYGKIVSFLVSATICGAIFFYPMTVDTVPELFPILFAVVTALTISAMVVYGIRFVRCLRKQKIELEDSGRLKLD